MGNTATAVRDFATALSGSKLHSSPGGLKLFAIIFWSFFEGDGWCFSQLWPLSVSFLFQLWIVIIIIIRGPHTHIYVYAVHKINRQSPLCSLEVVVHITVITRSDVKRGGWQILASRFTKFPNSQYRAKSFSSLTSY